MNQSAEFRARLVEWLRADLLGPSSEAEEIVGRPEARYTAGVLHPAFSAQKLEETDEALVAGDGEDTESDSVAAFGGLRQSAVGLSFSTDSSAVPMVHVSFGEYERPVADADTSGETDQDGEAPDAVNGGAIGENADPLTRSEPGRALKRTWKRHPHADSLSLTHGQGNKAILQGVDLEWRARSRGDECIWTVSVVNRRPKHGRPIFQPMIEVTLEDGRFVARPIPHPDDPDAALSALLYRDAPEYAVGHGCAADWSIEHGRAVSVRTEFLPTFEVPAVQPAGRTTAELRQGQLGRMRSAVDAAPSLLALVQEYRTWVKGRRATIAGLDETLRPTAATNLDACDRAADRMEAGVRVLQADPDAWSAFRFMNLTMERQRIQSLIAEAYRTRHQRIADPGEEPRWRAFQLAFILLNLSGLVDASSPDREIVDLLWFPTGGGKTEAYLGLTAFVIGLRRLRERSGICGPQGTTVLMRYTLRLLTTQQFERATTLIAACESMRCQHPDWWGERPIRIGLWVGQAATPNHYEAAVLERDRLAGVAKAAEKHPFVLRACPWCGTALAFPGSFVFDDTERRIRIMCSNEACEFAAAPGLPVVVIDETVYREPPDLLLATVDKFARMAWEPDSASLFGRATSTCSKHGFLGDPANHRKYLKEPPEAINGAAEGPGLSLIIQDELHLIAGPLGTLVGIYEIAVDFLAGRNGIPPKIVASTATIRSAGDQIAGLYGRLGALFPPPALDPFDSFFAEPAPSSVAPGRLYVGLTAPGTSMKTAIIRAYASLLSGVPALSGDADERDPYWTLVGYFNSLRELGGALSLMRDDVPKRLSAMEHLEGRPSRGSLNVEELTSRIPSYEIPNRLRQMEQTTRSKAALDALLASNMISVGVDVNRLGMMVVAGQPKGTAEYIQATSRVGRRHPGLVVTIYNWTRPRDLSHYERFRSYHAALYRHVEATSVTPLSSRARDRALEGVLVAVVRLSDARLRGDSGAAVMAKLNHADPMIRDFLSFFEKRAQRSDPEEAKAAAQDLEARIDRWMFRAALPNFSYRGSGKGSKHLIRPATDEPESRTYPEDEEAWRLLNSLRNIEREHGWYEA